jgi:hypothetical protein
MRRYLNPIVWMWDLGQPSIAKISVKSYLNIGHSTSAKVLQIGWDLGPTNGCSRGRRYLSGMSIYMIVGVITQGCRENNPQDNQERELMKTLDPGHVYQVDVYDGDETHFIKFMKREGVGYPGNIGTHAGTNCQELLRVLIDRVRYLDNQIPCEENKKVIDILIEALLLFEFRAIKRHGDVEKLSTCSICGHILCMHR